MFARTHLEVNIWEAAPSAEGPVDLQNRLVVLVGHDEFRGERVPLLYDVAHRVTGGSLHLQLWGRSGEVCIHMLQTWQREVKTKATAVLLTSCRQQGKKQDMHLSGLVTVMTSCPKLSRMWMLKGRRGPQHCRFRQSFSSTA